MQNTIALWHRFEVSLVSSIQYSCPFQDVRLTVDFISPDGDTNKVDGFWDGGQTWRVRFTPYQEGIWKYRTYCSFPVDLGLSNREGEFLCAGKQGSLPWQKHGMLRIADSHTHLCHLDGTPFFWMADTAWNGPLMSSQRDWEFYLNTRHTQGFNTIQWVTTQWIGSPNGNSAGEMAFWGNETIEINPVVFQKLDQKLNAINNSGFLAAPVLLWAAEWGDPEVMKINPGLTLPEDQAILLARYMLARWGAHFVVWILNGDGVYSGEKVNRWKRIGQSVFENNRTPVTMHPCGVAWFYEPFQDENWLSFLGYQSCHFPDETSLNWLMHGEPSIVKANDLKKPIINLEPAYENIVQIGKEESGIRFSDLDVRRALYTSLLIQPTAGVTYGAHGIWGWDDGETFTPAHERFGLPLAWKKALGLPGADQVKILVETFTSIPWWTMTPKMDMIVKNCEPDQPRNCQIAAQTADGKITLVYNLSCRPVELKLFKPITKLKMKWLNPKDGSHEPAKYTIGEEVCKIQPQSWDWDALLIID
jgi:hypothetical protein